MQKFSRIEVKESWKHPAGARCHPPPPKKNCDSCPSYIFSMSCFSSSAFGRSRLLPSTRTCREREARGQISVHPSIPPPQPQRSEIRAWKSPISAHSFTVTTTRKNVMRGVTLTRSPSADLIREGGGSIILSALTEKNVLIKTPGFDSNRHSALMPLVLSHCGPAADR